MPDAQIAFGSWLRRGLAAGIDRQDGTAGGSRSQVQLRLLFEGNPPAEPLLTLVGPGDIAGLDARAVVRTFPPADVNDAEAAFFVGLELDQADLPWRYTPARHRGDPAPASGAADDQLSPWITLVVLEETQIVELQPPNALRKLPLLTARILDLPDIEEGWAWAHTQARASTSGGSPDDLKRPGLVLGRLLCPRILEPGRSYQAFLVPTFERGRRVGMGQALDDRTQEGNVPVDALEPAWRRSGADSDDTRDLPVYYQWRFQTGPVRSFADLAAQLGLTEEPGASVGRRQLDVSRPGLGFAHILEVVPDERTSLGVAGALRSTAARQAEVEEDAAIGAAIDRFNTALSAFLDQARVQLGDRQEKIVVPPLYGRWYAGRDRLDPPGASNPPWFHALNRHPRNRVAAALGARVVQREQQALMTSAWRQIDKVTESNDQKNRLQTGRGAFDRTFRRHVTSGSLETRLTLTSELHSKVFASPTTVFAQLRQSPVPPGFFDPQWRRLSSPQGRIGRRLGLDALPAGMPRNLFQQFNSGQLRLAPAPSTPAQTFTRTDTLRPLAPGGLGPAQVNGLVDRLRNVELTFWGLVLFWVARQLLGAHRGQFWWLAHDLIKTGLQLIEAASPAGRTSQRLAEKLRSDTLAVADIESAPRTASFVALETLPSLADLAALPAPEPPGQNVPSDSGDAALFRTALSELTTLRRRPLPTPPPLRRLDLPALSSKLLQGLRPEVTLVQGIRDRHQIFVEGFPWRNPDPLERILAAPEFPQPMAIPLGELSPEWILPGVSQLPPNTVAALVPNRVFIESYMVGLNHEMTRELLFNQYPIDQRNTYFAQFWDSRGYVPGNADPDADRGTEGLKDIKPIRTWGASQLGANTRRVPSAEQLVLVIRGDLIRRYSSVVVYAERGTGSPRQPDPIQQRYPAFQGRLGSDLAYFGFDLGRGEARSDPGWFFILQESATAIRFGVPSTDAPPGYARPADFANGAGAASTAAQVAIRAFKPPVRVAIHASELIGP